MSFRILLWIAVVTVVVQFVPSATAQFYSGGCASCAGSAPVATTVSSCTPIQPVYSACYQRVPVTTYKPEKVTVEKPYYETEYEDQKVTYYEPVTRRRTIEVPTVSYRTVQENRTIHRDLGQWKTNYHPIAKCAPCQIDPRPGLFGWLNRTGYAFRNSLTPNYRTSRQYVPNMVACNVPYTRQVAVHGTKKVVVNETEMVARTKTERVAVRKLHWKKEVVTINRPVTAYRTVPIGSSLAYGGFGGGRVAYVVDDDDTQTALGPEPDENFREGDSTRTAKPFDEDINPRSSNRTFKRDSTEDDGTAPFRRTGYEQPATLTPPIEANPLNKAPRAFPEESTPEPTIDPAPKQFPDFETGRRDYRGNGSPASVNSRSVSAGGWKPSRRSANERKTATVEPPIIPNLSVARQ